MRALGAELTLVPSDGGGMDASLTHRMIAAARGIRMPWTKSLRAPPKPQWTWHDGWARRLAREETLFAGTSTGANVLAAIEMGRRLGREATVVTLACDSGMKYLSTLLYGS